MVKTVVKQETEYGRTPQDLGYAKQFFRFLHLCNMTWEMEMGKVAAPLLNFIASVLRATFLDCEESAQEKITHDLYIPCKLALYKIKIISLALHDYTRYLASHLANYQQNSLENSRANKKRKFDSLVRPLLNPFL